MKNRFQLNEYLKWINYHEDRPSGHQSVFDLASCAVEPKWKDPAKMNMYLDAKRIAFLVLSLLSFLFIIICAFSKGWTTYNGVNFGLFSPDISTNNVCGLVLKSDSSCLAWFRGAQALMVLAVLSHIVTLIGIILVEKRNMRFMVAGAGQFAVGVLAVLALVVYSFKSGYMTGIPAYDLGWAFKLSWVVCLFAIISSVIGLTDGTKGGGINL